MRFTSTFSGNSQQVSRQGAVTPFAVTVAAAMALLCPAIVAYSPYRLAWDDTYFLHRALSLHRAVWTVDAHQWAATFSIVTKSPVMALLPVGWPASPAKLLGLSLVSLAMAVWAILLACLYLARRLGVSWWLSLSAAAAIGLNPMLTVWAGSYMADILAGCSTLLLLLAIPYEAVSEDFTLPANVRRGVLWGAISSFSLLAKVTCWPFLLFASPAIVYLRLRRGGALALRQSLIVCLLLAAPALMITVHYAPQLTSFALSAAAGNAAHYFASPHESYGAVLLSYMRSMGAAVYLVGALLVLALLRRRATAAWYSILLLAAFAAQVTTAPVRDPRYFLPVAIGLPFLFAVAAARPVRIVPIPHRWTVLMLGAVAAFLVSWPMRTRIEFQQIQTATTLLEACRARNLSTIVLATDSQDLNIETLQLAKQLMGRSGDRLEVNTVAYGAVENRPIGQDFATLALAQAVIFETPTPDGPATVNIRVPAYREFAALHGKPLGLLTFGRLRTDIFAMSP